MKCSLQWNSPLMEEAWSSVRLSVARLISWIKIAKSEETITPTLTPCKIKKLSLLLLNHWFKTYIYICIGVASYREVWVGVCLARSNIGQRFGKQEFTKNVQNQVDPGSMNMFFTKWKLPVGWPCGGKGPVY